MSKLYLTSDAGSGHFSLQPSGRLTSEAECCPCDGDGNPCEIPEFVGMTPRVWFSIPGGLQDIYRAGLDPLGDWYGVVGDNSSQLPKVLAMLNGAYYTHNYITFPPRVPCGVAQPQRPKWGCIEMYNGDDLGSWVPSELIYHEDGLITLSALTYDLLVPYFGETSSLFGSHRWVGQWNGLNSIVALSFDVGWLAPGADEARNYGYIWTGECSTDVSKLNLIGSTAYIKLNQYGPTSDPPNQTPIVTTLPGGLVEHEPGWIYWFEEQDDIELTFTPDPLFMWYSGFTVTVSNPATRDSWCEPSLTPDSPTDVLTDVGHIDRWYQGGFRAGSSPCSRSWWGEVTVDGIDLDVEFSITESLGQDYRIVALYLSNAGSTTGTMGNSGGAGGIRPGQPTFPQLDAIGPPYPIHLENLIFDGTPWYVDYWSPGNNYISVGILEATHA